MLPPQYPLKPGAVPKVYKTASKNEVRKDGEKEFVCGFMNGKELKTSWEVGDIHRPLCSVSRMVKQGNCVWFDSESNGGCGVCNYKTGETIKIFERDEVYVMPAWIRSPEQSFPRQALKP